MNSIESPRTAEEPGLINVAYVILPTQLLVDCATNKISAKAYALYSRLLFWQGKNGKCWYSRKQIAKETGLSVATVQRLLTELVKAGHIQRIKRKGKSSDTICRTFVNKNREVYVCGQCVNAKWSRANGSGGAQPVTAKHSSTKRPAQWNQPCAAPKVSRPTVDQTESEEEHEWSLRQTWNERKVDIYGKIRENHPFPEAKELYAKRLAEDEEFIRRMYAEHPWNR